MCIGFLVNVLRLIRDVGKVKLAKHCQTGQYVAIKIVRKDFLAKKATLKKKMQREITVMKLVDHPNVLKLLDVFEIETHIFLVMEFVDGCELFEYLVRRGKLSDNEALDFFQQIICGLEYCHNRLICHRDLKPENLLLSARNRTLLIADFGMTSLNRPGSLLETSCGSPHYCSPSVISGEKYDGLKADIWSCGVILYAMLTGRLPFDDDNIQRLLLKVQGGRYRIPPEVPREAQSLIRSMLVVDPDKRITIAEIKKHPWFTRRRPRNYPPDDFILPRDPISNPDSRVVQGLVDLGWGDEESILKSLAVPDPNLERVFYLQLERHATFRDGKAIMPRRQTRPAAGDELSNDLSKMAISPTNGEADGKDRNAEGSEMKVSHSTLIRQTALAGHQVGEDGQKLEEAIQNANKQNHLSWFDSVRGYFTGNAGGRENEEKDTSNREENTESKKDNKDDAT